MALQDTDLLFVGRPNGANTDNYKTTVAELSTKLVDGFTGDVVVDGQTLTFTNGLLTAVA